MSLKQYAVYGEPRQGQIGQVAEVNHERDLATGANSNLGTAAVYTAQMVPTQAGETLSVDVKNECGQIVASVSIVSEGEDGTAEATKFAAAFQANAVASAFFTATSLTDTVNLTATQPAKAYSIVSTAGALVVVANPTPAASGSNIAWGRAIVGDYASGQTDLCKDIAYPTSANDATINQDVVGITAYCTLVEQSCDGGGYVAHPGDEVVYLEDGLIWVEDPGEDFAAAKTVYVENDTGKLFASAGAGRVQCDRFKWDLRVPSNGIARVVVRRFIS